MSRRRRRRVMPAQAPQTAASSTPELPLLQDAEQRIEAQLTPETQQNYLKIVVAGQRAALGGGPNGMMAKFAKNPDPVAACATGAVALVFILKGQAQGVMPMKALVPAGMTLMIKALDFIDKAGIAAVGNNELVRATTIYRDTLLKKIGVTPQMIQNGLVKAHSLTQDPVAMEQMKRKAGVTPHPLAQPITSAGAS